MPVVASLEMLNFVMSPRQAAIIVLALRAFDAAQIETAQLVQLDAALRGVGEDDYVAAEAAALAEMIDEAAPGGTNALCL